MDDEAYVLPLIRLVADEEKGYVPETVTRKEFEILQYEYCAALLAEVWARSKLGFVDVELPDIDNEMHVLTAILPSEALADFRYMLRELRNHRIQDARNKVPLADGYSWAPIGQTTAYGYHAPIDAWLILNEYGPAFLARDAEDSTTNQFHKWAQYWIQQPMPITWPSATDSLSTLIVPTDMRKAHSHWTDRRVKRARALTQTLFS
jgi:hypothetical protein